MPEWHKSKISGIYKIGVCAVNLRIGGAMHILEYENYEETKKHYDTDFSYNTYLCDSAGFPVCADALAP